MRAAAMTGGVFPEVVPPTSQVASLPAAPAGIRALRADEARIVAEAGRAALIWFSLFVVYGNDRPLSQSAFLGITFATLVWLVTLRSAAFSARVVLGRVVAATVGTGVGLIVVGGVNSSVVGLHLSLAKLAVCGLAVFCSASVWDWFVERTSAARRRVLLVGSEGLDVPLAEELRRCRRGPFHLVGAVTGSDDIAAIVDAQHPDIVVLTDESGYDVALNRLLDARTQVRVAGFASFFEYAFGRVPIEQITPAWFMSLLHPRQRIYTRFTKRTFDVIVAIIGLLAAAPLMAVLALLVRTTPGAILYRQTRVGEGGRHFTIYKFRTMECDAERDGPALSAAADPRTTRIGCVLRKTHVDEFPQLWNVLRGDMSIVGPRPERPEFIEMLEAAVPFWNRRLLVKPGVTGWAQVQCGYAADCDEMADKLSYDLWYLRNRSLAVDVGICVRTVGLQLRALLPGSASPRGSVGR
jgi:exopolysaccharide biosynthesis polyprenyl glycosylphosphotransferase